MVFDRMVHVTKPVCRGERSMDLPTRCATTPQQDWEEQE
jgi:hypothetical protein